MSINHWLVPLRPTPARLLTSPPASTPTPASISTTSQAASTTPRTSSPATTSPASSSRTSNRPFHRPLRVLSIMLPRPPNLSLTTSRHPSAAVSSAHSSLSTTTVFLTHMLAPVTAGWHQRLDPRTAKRRTLPEIARGEYLTDVHLYGHASRCDCVDILTRTISLQDQKGNGSRLCAYYRKKKKHFDHELSHRYLVFPHIHHDDGSSPALAVLRVQ